MVWDKQKTAFKKIKIFKSKKKIDERETIKRLNRTGSLVIKIYSEHFSWMKWVPLSFKQRVDTNFRIESKHADLRDFRKVRLA